MTGEAGDLAKVLLRCNKCGFCLAHCPIYKVTGMEWTTARGRISLLRSALVDKQVDLGELEGAVSNCLTCNACVDDCPAGLQTADIIGAAREEMQKRRGDHGMSRLVFQKLLASPSLMQKATGLLRVADATGVRPALRKTGLTRLIGDPGKAEAMVPRVARGTGLQRIARLAGRIEKPKYRVAYFVGCYAANLAPAEAAATIRILHRHQVEVTVPQFVCCGIPAPAYGDAESARVLARKNIGLASKLDVEAIVTPCASCSSFLKEYGKLLAGDAEWAGKARDFSGKVKDLSEFLVNIGLLTGTGTIDKRVTYHDPCHLARYQKIRQPPRTILKSIPGVEFIELREADMCCGAAGTYGFKNHDLSMKVLARKMGEVERIGPDLVVSSCPACIMQLSFGARRRKLPVQTLSLVEVLDQALSGG